MASHLRAIRTAVQSVALMVGLISVGMAATGTTATAQGHPSGWKTVDYRGAAFDVPAQWPILGIGLGSQRCVRFDVHAVYLGHQGSQPDCPSGLVGRTEAVHVEPLDSRSAERAGISAGEASREDRIDRSDATAHEFVVAFPVWGVLATITYGTDAAVAQRILESFRGSGNGSASPAPAAPGPAGRLTPQTITAATTYTGEGFDACTAPSTSTMNAWLASSYRSIGVYIGGVSRACSQGNLTSSWVTTVTQQGWKLVPTYVGLQAPCTSFTNRITPSSAASEGTAAADDAVSKASALGLGSGTPIYFDMEAYDSSNTSCKQAVLNFISAWVGELHAKSYVAGMYSSVASGIADQASIYNDTSYNRLDAIWFAHWNGVHGVFGDSYISDSVWPNHQRLHQYQGGHNETYGGVTINIDSDYDDGPTAVPGSPPDIALTAQDSPDPVTADSQLTYTLTVTASNGTMTGVNLTDTLPGAVKFGSASTTQGSCSGTTTVSCSLGSVAVGTPVHVTITVTPVGPGTLSNSGSVSPSDATPSDNSVSTSTTVNAQSGTRYVSVTDSGFSPSPVKPGQGITVQWDILGPSPNGVTDTTGLGLFSSGTRTPVDYVRYTFTAAGKYTVADVRSHTSSVVVPVKRTPATGSTSTSFTVTWASVTASSPFAFDVQMAYCSSTCTPSFGAWKTGVTGRRATFGSSDPAWQGTGSYYFRARLSKGTAHAGWSNAVTIAVS